MDAFGFLLLPFCKGLPNNCDGSKTIPTAELYLAIHTDFTALFMDFV